LIYDGVTSLEARRPIDRPADDGFEVSYVPDDSVEHRVAARAGMGSAASSRAFPFAGSRPGTDSAI
jgi:hypothetical protein